MSETFGVLGYNFKNCPLELRENLNVEGKRAEDLLRELKRAAKSPNILLLSTCNRFELYYYLSQAAAKELLSHYLNFLGFKGKVFTEVPYVYSDSTAIHHLFRVASSLDSLVVGETQILGQLKTAFQWAQAVSPFQASFSRYFEVAFHTAKRVRSETKIAENSYSIGRTAVDLARKVFEPLPEARVLVIGAGEIAELVLKYLKNEGVKHVTVTNRTYQTAAELAQTYQASTLPFQNLMQGVKEADIVLSSITIREPLLFKAPLANILKQRKYKPLFLIDLGVPRNVAADAAELENLFLFNIDDLQQVSKESLKARIDEANAAEMLIDFEREKLVELLGLKNNGQAVAAFREHLESLIQKELLPKLAHLASTNKEQELLLRAAKHLAHKLLHAPTLYLKNKPETASEALHILFECFEVPVPHQAESPKSSAQIVHLP